MSVFLPRCFGVLGDPIEHSRSPAMHAAAFAALGLPYRYLPFRVAPDRLEPALRGAAALGFGGLNLTLPHKQAALALCDELSPTAERIAAVNTLCFRDGAILGHNTDARGLLDALAELPGPAPRHATVLGSGGASLAVVDALLHGVPGLEITWVSRTPEQVVVLASMRDRVRVIGWDRLAAPRGDLLINTTTVGLAGGPEQFPVEFELGELEPRAKVIDVVYPRSPLLDRAAAAGLIVQDGLAMLLWQGVRALELWLDAPLEPEVVAAMRAALR
ncbi:shikimate dehydrogenase family protein [Nannocystaceae bacterium ST9]